MGYGYWVLLALLGTAADWPQFLGPTGDGKSAETGIRVPWPSAGLPVCWQAELGEGYAGTAVSDGRCFVFDRIGDQARVRALAADSGTQLWDKRFPTHYVDQYGYDGGPRAAPVLSGPRLFVYGADGWLRCLRVADGDLLWEKDLAREYGVVPNYFGVGSASVLFRNVVIVAVGGSPPDSNRLRFQELKGNGTGLVAFDQKTGREVWRSGDYLASYASPTVTQDLKGRPLGLWFAREGLVGFDPVAGQETFFFPWRARLLESVNAANPVVSGREVFITECYGPGGVLLKLSDENAPTVVWSDREKGRRQSLASHWSTPILHDNHLYGCHGQSSNEAELRCVEWRTGVVKWRQRGLGRTSLVYVDGHFIALAEDGQLLLIKANTERCELLSTWEPRSEATPAGRPRFLLEYPAWAAPIIAGGRLYVRGKDRLLCIDLMPPRTATSDGAK